MGRNEINLPQVMDKSVVFLLPARLAAFVYGPDIGRESPLPPLGGDCEIFHKF